MAERVYFSQGEEVEVGNIEEGLKGSWYTATVLQCFHRSSRSTTSKKKLQLLVEYHTLMTAKKGVKPLRENVDLSRVRPKPPPPLTQEEEADRSYQVAEKVEAFDNDGWWEGTVTKVLQNQRYKVYFNESGDEVEYHRSKLRSHFEWIDGRWVSPALAQEQEITLTPHDQGQNESPRHVQPGKAGTNDQNLVLPHQHSLDTAENVATENSPRKVQSRQDEETFRNTDTAIRRDASKNVIETKNSPSSFRISSKQTLKPSFSRGRLVEVCLDGDTCYGAWFPATVLKEIDNNCFLVEFQKLRLHARTTSLKEIVDSRHIRPFSPQTSHVKSYQLLDKVDAFYDGGWWSGLINRILAGSRYIVFFEHQNKLKEFSHSELRVHMDWTDGKWSENSKEISVAQYNQCGTESCRQALSEEAVDTDQIIDLSSPLSLDATKNVAAKLLPVQAQTQQDMRTFQSTVVAHPSSGGAVKNVASKKSHSPGISRKVDNQSSFKKTGSSVKAHNVDAAKKTGSEKSPSCLSGDAVKAPMSLIGCPVRGMSIGTLNKANGQHDFTTPTTEGKATNVKGKRARNPVVDENFLDHSFKRYSKDHPEPLNSGQDQTKHDLESNGPRNHPSVEGCSSHLPNRIDIAEDIEQDIEEHEMGASNQMAYAFYRRRQSREKFTSTKASVKGLKHTAASRETSTFVVQAEDTPKEIEMDASNDNRDLDQLIAMCIGESYLPSSIDEKEVSLANQSMEAITWKDAPMWGLKLQNPLNVIDNSYSLEGTTVANQPDEAIGDEHNECVMQSFLIEDDAPQEDESLPFIKCLPLWKNVESMEVFRAIPQRLHFRPLKQFNMELREGLAIGLTLSFTNIVEKIGKAEFDDPMCILQDRFNALEDLKAYGFDSELIQARIVQLLGIKEKHKQQNSQLVKAEEQVNENQREKVKLETELGEIKMEMRKMQECLNEMNKKWNSVEVENENQESKIAELKTTMKRIREQAQCARLEFNSVVAAPW